MSQNPVAAVELSKIRARAVALADAIFETPVIELASPFITQLFDTGQVFLKLECFQKTGTFKARGALSNAHSIPLERWEAGITAVSAGNHAIAAAWAARQLGLSAKVVMQSSANPFRVALAKAEGAEVIFKDGGPAAFAEAERIVREERRTLIHPFEGENVTLGTGGVGLEFIDTVPDLDAVIVGVGGGGLISGVAAAIKQVNPRCAVYGVEPKGAASMSLSLAEGRPVTLDRIMTVADNLAPPMALPFAFGVIAHYVDNIVTVSDDDICAGMAIYQEEAKLAVEPAGAAALAGAVGPLRQRIAGKRIGIVVCGANIDTESYLTLTERGRRHISHMANQQTEDAETSRS
ncbi:pyridoxal-phosphate dependent enzyme (plasmid) [Rhizobium lusitanum]|nr:pyridoxal-phosphate dependent enzyme [Rhizobium lusitanum]